MEKKVKLCILGASGAGLSAAIFAAQHGMDNILVLEKMKNTGGCTKTSGGMFAVDSPVQRRQGKFYNADDAFRDLIHIHNWNCDAKLVRKWIMGSGENIRWLENLGLLFDICATETSDPNQFRNTHHMIADWDGEKWIRKMQGPYVHRALLDGCKKYGVEIICSTRGRKLIQDDSGRVIGVRAEGPEGELTVYAEAVILCTGSISSNQDLIRRFYGTGEYKDIRIMAQVPHNTGDGLIMAEEIGAAPGRIASLFIGPHNHFPGASELTGMLARRPHTMKVNMYGERFVDESLPTEEEFGWMLSLSVDNQPGKKCYVLLDQDLVDAVMAGEEYMTPRLIPSIIDYPPFFTGMHDDGTNAENWRSHVIEHIKHEEEKGRAKICNSINEVAAYIGCEADVLQKTVNDYNLACAKKYDIEFLKEPKYLIPVAKPPFYVLDGYSGIDTCLGGLKVDNHQRVLKMDGSIIPGLFAAGVICSGWCNGAYCFFGSEMSFTIYSGRSAGQEATGFIFKNQ